MLTLLPILLVPPILAQAAPLPMPPSPPPPPAKWEGPPPPVTPGLCRAVANHMTQMAPLGRELMDDNSELRGAIDRALVESGGKPMKPADAAEKAEVKNDAKLAAKVIARYGAAVRYPDLMLAMRMPLDVQRAYAASCLEGK